MDQVARQEFSSLPSLSGPVFCVFLPKLGWGGRILLSQALSTCKSCKIPAVQGKKKFLWSQAGHWHHGKGFLVGQGKVSGNVGEVLATKPHPGPPNTVLGHQNPSWPPGPDRRLEKQCLNVSLTEQSGLGMNFQGSGGFPVSGSGQEGHGNVGMWFQGGCGVVG